MYSNVEVWDSEFFFNRLDYFLKKQNMSMHELSCMANTSISALYQTRSRKALPSLQTICTICDVLCIKLWEFFATENDISPEMQSIIADMQSVSIEGQRMLTQMVKYIK